MATVEELEAQLEAVKKQNRDMRVKVVETARKYAVAHSLCDVVDQALEEAGLGPKIESVQLEVMVAATVQLDVDALQLENMTEEEKQAQIARSLKFTLGVDPDSRIMVRPVGVGGRRRGRVPTVQLGAVEIKGVGEIPPPPPDPHGAPRGYVARYTGIEGRVLHFFLETDTFQDRYISTLCGGVSYIQPSHLRENSPRGENRVCEKCQRRARNINN